jgi:hypothetical protein
MLWLVIGGAAMLLDARAVFVPVMGFVSASA